ncbi:hypothetical protein [Hymenobacter jeollabukensis]|uniref:Uncharacterized protein n=1 Tax=Hymenobacter jeollabukensis TaxID=2025313 RepID=A0A5R8WRF8_9BACT|nr:hypothetical protein [Hymenobacter jeollabukensis]TLM93043.1 hypothetical protein FDY95_10420 [Hymenobacter jeollabukensis]
MAIPASILAQLHYGRTANGAVGCRVLPTGDNPDNQAWLKVIARKAVDARVNPPHETVWGYEVEYLELRADYDEDQHGFDYDLFYVRREIYYNLKDEAALIHVVRRWLSDLQQLRPLANTDYPA